MTRDRIRRNHENVPARGDASGALGNIRNFRQEANSADDQLTQSLGELATTYASRDVRNRGAQ
jgi:hypothetical protein